MEKLRQRILHRYPEVKISYFNDVIAACSDTNKLFTLLSHMRKDKDRFIIIENINKTTFRDYAFKLLGQQTLLNQRVNEYRFIIMRGEAIAISRNVHEELEFILKQVLKQRQSECRICYNEINGERVTCYHCKNEICFTCAQQLFDTTAYWCGFCGHHYLYPNLGKPSDIDQDVTELEFHIRRMTQQCISYITDSEGKLIQHTSLIGLPLETCARFHQLGATIADFDEDYLQNISNVTKDKCTISH